MDLITVSKYKDNNDYVNDLTREMDKHIKQNSDPKFWYNYIYEGRKNAHGWYSFRYPGATRGGIKVNEDGIIEKIEFFRDIPFIYKDSVEEAVKKFIGSRIVFNQ